MASIFISPFTNVGSGITPSDGAKLFFFALDVVTPKDTFSVERADPGDEHANPVIANAAGVFPEIWIEGSYVAVLKDKNDVQQWQSQPFASTIPNSDLAITKDTIAAATGDDDLVNFVGGFVLIARDNSANDIAYLYEIVAGVGTPSGLEVINSDTASLFHLVLVERGYRPAGTTLASVTVQDAIGELDANDVTNAATAAAATAVVDTKYEHQGLVGITFATPAAFVHRVGDFVYSKSSTGNAKLVTDLSPFLPAGHLIRSPSDVTPGLKAYFVSRLGDNSTGLSFATAFNSIATALAQGDVDVILVDGQGVYTLSQNMGTYTGTRDIAMISVGGRAIQNVQTEETWSAGAQPNTFLSSALGGTPVQAIDTIVKDGNGDFIPLTFVATESEVSTSPGTWTRIGSGGGQQAVVRLSGDDTPTNERLWIQRSSVIRFSGVASKMYMYGFDFYGSSAGAFTARSSDIDAVIAAENCGFFNCFSGDGYQIKDVGMAIAINCRASANENDGFNYHELTGLTPHIVELDCVGMANLAAATGNGSTCHEDVVCFRLNGGYFDNKGPGIADVGESKTYNVCCNSNANESDPNAWGAQITGTTAEAWFDGYVGDGNQTTEIGTGDTGTIHYRDCFPVPTNESGTGTIDQDFS